VVADGASAAVLSRRGGFARVLSAVTVSDPHLEGAHRGAAPFAATPAHEELPIDLRARTLDFLQSVGLEETGRRMEAGLRSAVGRAVAEAGIELRDAQHIVVPAFGRQLLTRELLDQLDVDLARTTWEWSSRVGHIGAADQCAALTYLSEAGRLEAGEHVVLLGVGGGFNWSCVVLEVLGEPAWAA
jgi:3-oxoacyl-[acyl-carrier-protein] synthase-3